MPVVCLLSVVCLSCCNCMHAAVLVSRSGPIFFLSPAPHHDLLFLVFVCLPHCLLHSPPLTTRLTFTLTMTTRPSASPQSTQHFIISSAAYIYVASLPRHRPRLSFSTPNYIEICDHALPRAAELISKPCPRSASLRHPTNLGPPKVSEASQPCNPLPRARLQGRAARWLLNFSFSRRPQTASFIRVPSRVVAWSFLFPACTRRQCWRYRWTQLIRIKSTQERASTCDIPVILSRSHRLELPRRRRPLQTIESLSTSEPPTP